MQKPSNKLWSYGKTQSWLDQFDETKSLCQKHHDTQTLNIKGRPYCLIPTFASPLVTSQTPGRRCMWIRLSREVAPFIQYPVDIQFYIDHTSIDPKQWSLLLIWFQGQMFSSTEELLHKYHSGEFKVIKQQFVDMYPNQLKPGPNQYKAAKSSTSSTKSSNEESPQSTKPKIHRIYINKRRIKYDRWDFHVTMRRDTGLRLFGVYYANVSLLSEAGLDETVTAYWGRSPFMKTMTSLESMYGVGGMTSELSPGLDCPKNAIYLPVQLIPSGEIGPKVIKNGICLFEWKANPSAGPVRRHFEFSTNDDAVDTGNANEAKHTNFGFGSTSQSLVLRAISSLYNYDYLFDIIFYPTGVIEFSVTPTGYIHVDAELHPFQSQMKYGYSSAINPIYFVIHHHLFHFKIDVDIVNRRNFMKVIKIRGPLTEDQVNTTEKHESSNQSTMLYNSELLWMSTEIPKTEMSARFSAKFESPKQYLICSTNPHMNESNKTTNDYFRHDKCLIIVNKAQIKTVFHDEHTKSFAWSRHQLYVTRQHDNESFASSIFNGVDLTSPVVDFTKFSSNNESIFNEDLVLWLTVGNYHLPRQEDLPNTVTSGGPLSILLMPHNLFTYSPDAFSCNRFYTQELNEWINGPQMEDDCKMESIPEL
ncbi:unnamed protein product [Heterobilharzia americana]|nr:unnamed protein product [Heterobilharzia americana]